MSTRILVVEDDIGLARVIQDSLTFAGFAVECVHDGNEAMQSVQARSPDLILLDVMLPGHDGFELCRVLRRSGRLPIIMLTARSQQADRVRGLNAGADDYLTKPYYPEELLARIKALLRRSRPVVERVVLGDVEVDFVQLRAVAAGRDLHLTRREFELLRYLAAHHGHPVSRENMLREVWGYLEVPNTRAVDDAIVRLRRKLGEHPRSPRFVQTAHGDGYCLSLAAELLTS